MLSLPVLVSLALVPFAAAQSDHTLDIKAIEAHFTQSHIVPDLFSSFTPSALLTLNYAGVGNVTPGQALTKEQVAPAPTVTVTAANSSVQLSGTYTLAMVDADVVGSDLSKGVTRHWLVNGVTVAASTVSNSSATAITTYAGPGPAAGSGPHRYIVALYQQPSTFTAPAAFSQPNMGVSVFDFLAYIKDSGLGPLVAATYIDVEEGTATASIAATSSVVSSTLVVSTTSASQTATSASSSVSSTGTGGAKNGAANLLPSSFAALFAGLVVFVTA